MEGDCKSSCAAAIRLLPAGAAPRASFSAIAPWKGTARAPAPPLSGFHKLFQRHRPVEGDCKRQRSSRAAQYPWFQRHRPVEGDCKDAVRAGVRGEFFVSAPSPRGRGLQGRRFYGIRHNTSVSAPSPRGRGLQVQLQCVGDVVQIVSAPSPRRRGLQVVLAAQERRYFGVSAPSPRGLEGIDTSGRGRSATPTINRGATAR